MLILGLAGGKVLPDGTIVPGSAGVGKDTVADYLVEQYGFTKFAFSDRLYDEVQAAYGLEDQELLRGRDTKEIDTVRLLLNNCYDTAFRIVAIQKLHREWGTKIAPVNFYDLPLSPRWITQTWGTEYRRAQSPNYWLDACSNWLDETRKHFYPEHRPLCYVNTTCRFSNEQLWIHGYGGNVWHLRRPVVTTEPTHVSEQLLPVLEGERELWNCDTIQRLYGGVDLLMRTSARFVHVLPMEKTDAA